MRIKSIFIICWFSFLTASFFFRPRGFIYGWRARQENKALALIIALLRQDIQALNQDINNWKNYDFFKEQRAREKLQMAAQDELIYLTGAMIQTH